MNTLTEADIDAADEGLRSAHGTPENAGDPYAGYARMRSAAPFYRSRLDGMWYATTYDDCKALLVDPRLGLGVAGVRYGVSEAVTAQGNARIGTSMLSMNPPEHTRLRGLANKAFTPRQAERLRAGIREIAEPMVAALAERPEVMATIAYPLPVTVIGELIGVPPEDHAEVRVAWNAAFALAAPGVSPEVAAAARRGSEFLDDYFAGLIAGKRAHPADDLLSGLIAARDSRGALSEQELREMLRLLYLAGYVTTTHLIGNGLYALLQRPRQRDLLWAEPARVPAAVEEMLRYENPVLLTRRVVLEPLEHAGHALRPGDNVVLVLAAANRDPARYADPEGFDIARFGPGGTEPAPLSFGWGIHHCIGAPLAHVEAQTVLELLIQRYAGLDLAEPNQAPPQTDWFLRGLRALPVRVNTSRSGS